MLRSCVLHGQGYGGGGGGGAVGENPPCNTLFVGNLSETVNEAELNSIFAVQPVRCDCIRSPSWLHAVDVSLCIRNLRMQAWPHTHGTAIPNAMLQGLLQARGPVACQRTHP